MGNKAGGVVPRGHHHLLQGNAKPRAVKGTAPTTIEPQEGTALLDLTDNLLCEVLDRCDGVARAEAASTCHRLRDVVHSSVAVTLHLTPSKLARLKGNKQLPFPAACHLIWVSRLETAADTAALLLLLQRAAGGWPHLQVVTLQLGAGNTRGQQQPGEIWHSLVQALTSCKRLQQLQLCLPDSGVAIASMNELLQHICCPELSRRLTNLHLELGGADGTLQPGCLSRMTGLTSLTFKRDSQQRVWSDTDSEGSWLPHGLQQLTLGGVRVRSLLPDILACISLQQLCLEDAPCQFDLPALTGLTGLTKLHVDYAGLASSAAAALPRMLPASLESVQLQGTNAKPWGQHLAACPQLQQLEVKDCWNTNGFVGEDGWLHEMPQLRSFGTNTSVSPVAVMASLERLTGLTALTRLSLADGQMTCEYETHWRQLAALPQLKVLKGPLLSRPPPEGLLLPRVTQLAVTCQDPPLTSVCSILGAFPVLSELKVVFALRCEAPVKQQQQQKKKQQAAPCTSLESLHLVFKGMLYDKWQHVKAEEECKQLLQSFPRLQRLAIDAAIAPGSTLELPSLAVCAASLTSLRFEATAAVYCKELVPALVSGATQLKELLLLVRGEDYSNAWLTEEQLQRMACLPRMQWVIKPAPGRLGRAVRA